MDFQKDNWKKDAANRQKAYKQAINKARKKKGKERILPQLHEEAFSKIDCLDCGGCCKNISPRFKSPDIVRISKFLNIKQSELIETYLNLDTDGDYVVKTSPCPFLGPDNYCSVYEARPRDCRNYPYTDSGDFFEYPSTTLSNSTICPAVYYVLEQIEKLLL